MSNYTKATDFAAKDALPTGNPSKVVVGTEIDDEYNAIATAVNSKADAASPALTGTATAVNLTLSGTLTANGTIDANSTVDLAGATVTGLDASETAKGIIELATQDETNTGTDDTRAITPLKLENWTGGNTANWDAAYNDKINSASFATGTGVLTLTQQDAGTVTVDLDGRYLEAESDTLADVTGRGATTSTACTFNGVVNFRSAVDFGDNDILRFGDSDDVEFYHDGAGGHSYLELNNTGDLYIRDTATNKYLFDKSTGDFHADGDVIAYSTSVGSDIALKQNITVVEDALDKLTQLRGVEFLWKRNGEQSAGVLAQEVEEVLPSAVKNRKSLSTEEEFKTVDYNALLAIVIEAVKELKEKVDGYTK